MNEIVNIIGSKIFIDVVYSAIKKLVNNKQTLSQQKRERLSEALASIQIATIKTRDFIQNHGYEANTELSELRADALKKSINANIEDLPEFLINKSKFWGAPNDWLDKPETLEMLPKLNYLDEKCNMLLIELNYYRLQAGRFDSAYKAAKVILHQF